MPILTGFGPNPRGPKSGQGKLADLDALCLPIPLSYIPHPDRRSKYRLNTPQSTSERGVADRKDAIYADGIHDSSDPRKTSQSEIVWYTSDRLPRLTPYS